MTPPFSLCFGVLHYAEQRQLAVAAGGDGTLRVLDVLRSDPLLLLEPAAGGLLAAAWSPTRPLVFAAASGGCDLQQRKAVDGPRAGSC